MRTPASRFYPLPKNEVAGIAGMDKASPAEAGRTTENAAAAGINPGARIPVYFPKDVTSELGFKRVYVKFFIAPGPVVFAA